MCFSPDDFVHSIALLTVEAYDARFAATYSFLSVHNRTLHGISPPCGFEVVPYYASVYVRRQVCSGEYSCNRLLLRLLSREQEEKERKLLRVRLDMAKFLQETLRESGLKANAHIVGSDAFKEFFRKVYPPHLALPS
jgi:hypothetical protein